MNAAFARLTEDSLASDASAALLLRDGEVIWSFEDPARDADELLHTASVTKFVVGLCVAHAVHSGLVGSVGDPASVWLTEWAGDDRSAITLRHLMTHTSGLPASWPQKDEADPMTPIALALEPTSPPGKSVAYNNHGAQLVAEVVRRASGKPIDEYAAANLFEPLGIARWRWNRGSDGLPFGMSALQLLPRDLARIGELSLARGLWGEQRLFAEDWGEEDRRPGRPFGLLEQLIPEIDVVVDLEGCEQPGAELDVAVRRLAGSTVPLNGARSMWTTLGRAFGPAGVRDAFAELRRLAPKIRFSRPTLQAHGHEGDGGQELWVVPSVGGVAIRMRDVLTKRPGPASAFTELALEALLD